MAGWFYLEYVLAERAREVAGQMAEAAARRSQVTGHERAVLSGTLAGWNSARASRVAGLVALAVAGTLGVPAGILGAVWTIERMVGLLLK
jgi:hypothetical protein